MGKWHLSYLIRKQIYCKLIHKEMNKNEMIDRCIAIEKEYDNLDNITLSIEDVEDVSDGYQEKLELKWHEEELKSEYKELNKELGYSKRRLWPKSKRRLIM